MVDKLRRGIGGHTDDGELDGHVEAKDVEEDLEGGPFCGTEQPPCSGGENEGVPGSDSEGADEEVLVGRQVRRQV